MKRKGDPIVSVSRDVKNPDGMMTVEQVETFVRHEVARRLEIMIRLDTDRMTRELLTGMTAEEEAAALEHERKHGKRAAPVGLLGCMRGDGV